MDQQLRGSEQLPLLRLLSLLDIPGYSLSGSALHANCLLRLPDCHGPTRVPSF